MTVAEVEMEDLGSLAEPEGKKRAGWRSVVQVWAVRILFLAVVVGAWQLASVERWVNPTFAGTPTLIGRAFGDAVRSSSIRNDLVITLEETLIGWIVGAAAGFVVGFLFARYQVISKALNPIMTAINSVPRIALAPLFIVWFGLGQLSKIALSVSLVFFIVLSNTLVGLTSTDRDLLLLASSLGATERQRIRHFVLPAAIPVIGAAIELGLIFSFLGVVSGEIIGAKAGLGVLLNYDASVFQMNQFFAALIILAIVTTILTSLVHALQRRLLRWHYIELRGFRSA